MNYFYPSNGSELSSFNTKYCDFCTKTKCKILLKSLTGDHVEEWVYIDNSPTCTKFNDKRGIKRKRKPIKNQTKIF
jgi:hypothetical protein